MPAMVAWKPVVAGQRSFLLGAANLVTRSFDRAPLPPRTSITKIWAWFLVISRTKAIRPCRGGKGDPVGATVGVGWAVGPTVGFAVGALVSPAVGLASAVGADVAGDVGVGWPDGPRLG